MTFGGCCGDDNIQQYKLALIIVLAIGIGLLLLILLGCVGYQEGMFGNREKLFQYKFLEDTEHRNRRQFNPYFVNQV